MEILPSKLHLASLIVMSLLSMLSHEVTVRSTDLTWCKDDDKVCVRNVRDCDPRPPSSVQKTLNLSCYYQIPQQSVTCEWGQDSNSHTESEVSLIFSSKSTVISCTGLFVPAAIINITARIRNYNAEIWSQPHPVFLYEIIKPAPPALTVVGSTHDSLVVSWRSMRNYSFRFRYRVNNTQTWSPVLIPPVFDLQNEKVQSSEAPDLHHTRNDQKLVYMIKDLLPFNVYIVSVACREDCGIWSDWSSGVTARTLETVPSKSPQLRYRLEKTDSGGRLLHLVWKALDPYDAGGRILGYQVHYSLVTQQQLQLQLQDRFIQNVTEEVAHLEVEEGKWRVTVTAFNAAGYGPSAHLSIDTQRQNSSLPSVRNMWISSSFPAVKALKVQWRSPTDRPSALPVSHFDIQWCAETYPSTSRWSTVNGSTTFTLISDVEPDESYLISVFPVYNQQRGAPQSLTASLQQGALMEVGQVKVTGVSKTTVTVVWVWQKTFAPVRVNEYRMMLRSDSEKQMQSVWPDRWQHTFLSLTPNTEYSLVLLVDNVTRIIIPVRTDFDEVPVVATATPLLLLAVTVLIISVLSRTVYKGNFFPPISSPRNSSTGQWLMDSKRKNSTHQNILDIKDFQETDIIGVKSAIVVGPRWSDLHDDIAHLPLGQFSISLSDVKLDTDYVSNTPLTTEHQLQCYLPDKVSVSDESREVAVLHHLTFNTDDWFPQKEEEQKPLDCRTSQQADNAVKCCFHKLTDNTGDQCVSQIACEPEYVVNSSYQRKSEQTDCSLVCETDYIPNIAVLTYTDISTA